MIRLKNILDDRQANINIIASVCTVYRRCNFLSVMNTMADHQPRQKKNADGSADCHKDKSGIHQLSKITSGHVQKHSGRKCIIKYNIGDGTDEMLIDGSSPPHKITDRNNNKNRQNGIHTKKQVIQHFAHSISPVLKN